MRLFTHQINIGHNEGNERERGRNNFNLPFSAEFAVSLVIGLGIGATMRPDDSMTNLKFFLILPLLLSAAVKALQGVENDQVRTKVTSMLVGLFCGYIAGDEASMWWAHPPARPNFSKGL